MGFYENKAQEEAIKAIKGPVMIVSCPGSGKTTTLIRRIHNMIEHGIDPHEILMVTFANAAARDMKSRYLQMYGEESGVTFATIHSLCFNILIQEGLCTKESLLQEREKQDYFFFRLRKMPWVSDAYDTTIALLTEISVVKNNRIDLTSYEPKSCERKVFADLYKKYEQEKDARGKIDFDDMLIKALRLLQTNSTVLAKWRKRFRYIQCDEYQDTNYVQRDILYLLAGPDKNLCVVGDDDQSIYRFRGADSSIMLNFGKDFPEAKIIMMSTNYRSAQRIVDMADECIKFNRDRFEKQFISFRGQNGMGGYAAYMNVKSKKDEMDKVLELIKKKAGEGVPYREMAILVRTNKQASLPAQTLSDANIPFDTTERIRSIYEEWMFEDIRSYIMLSMGNGTDKDMMRIVNRPARYIREAALNGVSYDTQSLIDAIRYMKDGPAWQYQSAQKSVFTWMNNFGPGKVTRQTEIKDLFSRLTGKDSIRYDKYISSYAQFRNMDFSDLREQFDDLKRDAMRFETVGEWLAHANRVIMKVREDNARRDINGVKITTMHKSKGQEWKTVFVIDVNTNIVPHKNSSTLQEIEEERRLLYVAMTRAKDTLYVMCSGSESDFMTKTMAALKERYAPTIPKKLAGTPVEHITFGKGTVMNYSKDKIAVNFPGLGTKKFKFPETFREGKMKYL